MLAERTGLSVEQAFSRTRTYARGSCQPLRTVASAVVDSTLNADELQPY